MNDFSNILQEIQSDMLLTGIDTEDALTFYNILNKLQQMSSQDLKDADLALSEIVNGTSVYSS